MRKIFNQKSFKVLFATFLILKPSIAGLKTKEVKKKIIKSIVFFKKNQNTAGSKHD